MKLELVTEKTKYIFSKDEFGFQEVIDDMTKAKEITIITYNISKDCNRLINRIKSAPSDCVVKIFTNIPCRWNLYHDESDREQARALIRVYINKLNPMNFQEKSVSVYFNFENHGKLIMTDNIVYVGSENYSEASARNIEFGFLSKDKRFIQFIKEEILPQVLQKSEPYYEYNDPASILLEAKWWLSEVKRVNDRLFEETYQLIDETNEKWVYRDIEAGLTRGTLENIENATESISEITRDLFDAFDIIANCDEDKKTRPNSNLENFLDRASRIEELINKDTLNQLAIFDKIEDIHQQLNNEYSMEAFEESLESYIELAVEEANCKVEELTHNALNDIDQLLEEIKSFINDYSEIINLFTNFGIRKVNPAIDNTTS